MTDIWAPLRYGWDHVYWLTIDGIPYVWSENDTGLTVPSGYTSTQATLVIDQSASVGAQIDRDAGIGAGFPLSFQLLDSSALASMMTRPARQTYLTAAATSSATTLHVADTSAFDSTGTIYIGQERITYTGKTGTSFTGCTRGTCGLAYPHRTDGGGVLVTDSPRYWRGRYVTLYALPVDATGYATGSAWTYSSAVIWRGYLDAEPERGELGWYFQAMPLDRLLARELVGSLTGELTDLEPRFPVASDAITINVTRWDTVAGQSFVSFTMTPFADAGYSVGDWIGVSQANAAIKAAWTAARSSAAVTWLGDILIVQAATAYSEAGAGGTVDAGDWIPVMTVTQSANTDQIRLDTFWFGQWLPPVSRSWGATGAPADVTVWLGLSYSWTPYDVNAQGQFAGFELPRGSVRFDEGDPGTIPDSGLLKIGSDVWAYNDVLQTPDAALVQFVGLSPIGHTTQLATQVGASVEVVIRDTGLLDAVTLRCLHSSGEAALRDATYDALPGIIGYGLPSSVVDQTSFTTLLKEGWLSSLSLSVSLAGQSLADVVGGALALSGKALVVTDDADGGDAAVAAVHTSASGGSDGVSLTDAHLIVRNGGGVRVSRLVAPNSITVELQQAGETVFMVRELDRGRIASEGAQSRSWTLPSGDKSKAAPAVAGWALSRIVGDSQTMMVEVDVVPWLPARPGLMVDCTLTHPALWDWDAGAPGYTGRARCIGREVKLQDGVQTLTLLIDGIATGTAICPAAAVSAYAGTAAAPTTIDIPRAYYPLMAGALADTNPMRLLHYEPGDSEPTGEYYLLSAVTDTGAVCRLTVDTVGGGAVLSSSSFLTWPESANGSTFQNYWMHDADGSRWL